MPQLDILIFQYENLNFIIGFFLFFFLNQYYIFPLLLRNIVLRRKLITRNLSGSDFVLFSSFLLNRLKMSALDNIIFRVKVSSLNETIMFFFNYIINFYFIFKNLKVGLFRFYFFLFRDKANLVVWLNYLR